MNKEIVKELIQDELNTENLVRELSRLLKDENHLAKLYKDYQTLHTVLSAGGNASKQAAEKIMQFLKKK
jgi:lipid-A-disaccharide synthase